MFEEIDNFLKQAKQEENIEKQADINALTTYYSAFFSKYSTEKMEDTSKISIIELIKSALYLNDFSFLNKKEAILNAYPEIFKPHSYKALISCLIAYNQNPDFKIATDTYLAGNFFTRLKSRITHAKLSLNLGYPLSFSFKFLKQIRKNPDSLSRLSWAFKSFSIASLTIVDTLLSVLKQYHEFNTENQEKRLYDALKKEYKKSGFFLIRKHQTKNQEINNIIYEYFSSLYTKYHDTIKAYEKEEKARKKYNQKLDGLRSALNTDAEIKNIDQIVSMCPTKELLNVVLNYIANHNQKIYARLTTEYDQAIENSHENLQVLFSKYGYNLAALSPIEEKPLKSLPFEKIEDILKRLKALGLTTPNITKIDATKLTTIENLISRGLITSSWLNENPTLLYPNNSSLNKVLANINTLSENGINILSYPASLDLLLSSNILMNLSELKVHSLSITKLTTDISFLKDENLAAKIEFIISLGLYPELKCLDILNNSLDYLYRLKASINLNIPLEQIDDSSDLACDLIPALIPPQIISLLNFDASFATNLPFLLKGYVVDKESLNINGVYVSITKVKRNLGKLGREDNLACFYAIIYESLYTYDEIIALKDALMPELSFSRLVRRIF